MEMNEQPSLSPPEAMARIAEMENFMRVMGANDSEFDVVRQVIQELENQTISPSEAVRKVQVLLNSKQNYH